MKYGEIKSLLVLLSLVVVGLLFARKLYRILWVGVKKGAPGEPYDRWMERFRGLLVFVGGQKRLFRVLLPGTGHFFIFWGFLFLSLTILQAILEGLLSAVEPELVIPILGTFGPLALLQEIFAVLVIAGVIYGLYLRIVVNPERYRGSHRNQGILVLTFILIIVVSLLMMSSLRITLGRDPIAAWRPVSLPLSAVLANLNEETRIWLLEGSYWVHLLVIMAFLIELPGGKHFHVLTSIPAVLLRNLDPPGRLPPAPVRNGSVGVGDIYQMRWRQMLDFLTCTECGRCQDACPAYASGLDLSPKLFIMSLRDHLIACNTSAFQSGGSGAGNGGNHPPLVGDILSENSLWACTTCLACDQECPLFVEHVAPLVDVRRHLIMEGAVDEELQTALSNLARYGNSFGKSPRQRARWTRELSQPVKDARNEPVDILWFVGDYASYNPALTQITRITAEIFSHAGVDYGILYEGEHNTGNDVRRVGEEGLFEMLVDENVAVLEQCEYNSLVTTDPHSLNTLKNEYPPALSQNHEVMHSAELFDRLLTEGKLRLRNKLGYRVTYHDPCYLGRYNGVYDAPRRVIAATGCELVEMPSHGDRSVCCGAGGGRIWMEEGTVRERPSERRIRSAVALEGVELLVVACPKDVTMYRDAVKTTGFEDRIVVKDLSELVYEAL